MKRNKSDTDSTARYIKVPLPMFRLLIQDKRNIKDVIAYGVYLTAMSQQISVQNAVLQLLYAYFNQDSSKERVKLTGSLYSKLDYLEGELGFSEDDYRGFYPSNCGQFEPQALDDVARVLIVKKCEEYPDFASEVVEFHALRQVAELFNLNWLDVESMIKVHRRYKHLDNYPVYAYANIKIMLEYMNDIKEKSDDDIACLLMYMAYKSIIGDKEVAKACTELVTARMVGAKGRDELESIFKKYSTAKKFYERYSKREVFERIRAKVVKYKFIPIMKTIPGRPGLGTFVSCNANISEKKLGDKIYQIADEERKRKNRERVANYRKRNSLHSDNDSYLAKLFAKRQSKDVGEDQEQIPF